TSRISGCLPELPREKQGSSVTPFECVGVGLRGMGPAGLLETLGRRARARARDQMPEGLKLPLPQQSRERADRIPVIGPAREREAQAVAAVHSQHRQLLAEERAVAQRRPERAPDLIPLLIRDPESRSVLVAPGSQPFHPTAPCRNG